MVHAAARGARTRSSTVTQQQVTGEVRLKLYKGSASAGRAQRRQSLYRQDLATFGDGKTYDQSDAEGFIQLFGLPVKVRALVEAK